MFHQILLDPTLPEKILAAKENAWLGVNLNQSCLRLRAENHLEAPIIYCIPSNDFSEKREFSHIKILHSQIYWAFVEVVTMAYDPSREDEGEDCHFVEKVRYKGWVKAVSSNGFPNIWYSVNSY